MFPRRTVRGRVSQTRHLKDDRVLEAQIDLARDPAAVGVARRFVDHTLRGWELDFICADAQLIASELCANAVVHARTAFRITLRSNGFGFLRMEVLDQNRAMPSALPWREDATGGRGLALIDALATCWGADPYEDGKVVWAEIGWTTPSSHRERRGLPRLHL